MQATKRPSNLPTKGGGHSPRPTPTRPTVVGHATTPPRHHATTIRSAAFTTTEILIVIGLIVLLVTLAVPAFNLITGGRSLDAGENLVSAMLGRARAEAMRNKFEAGVLFFVDPKSDRTTMVLVAPAASAGSTNPEPSGLENYKAWSEFKEGGASAGAVHYEKGDVVVALVRIFPDETWGATTVRKLITQQFICITPHDASQSKRPTNPPADPWGILSSEPVDMLAGYEFQPLPIGVGVQTVNEPAGGQLDQYLSIGLIMFDAEGNLQRRHYEVLGTSNLGITLGLGATNINPGGAHKLYSQLGILLYDRELFKNANGAFDDAITQQFDPQLDGKDVNDPAYNELPEENWLNNNSRILMINRYNGLLGGAK